MFPSPADVSERSLWREENMSEGSSRLYPDLDDPGSEEVEQGDSLAPLPSTKRPPQRPPPPPSRTASAPSSIGTAGAASVECPVSLTPPNSLHSHEVRWFYQEPGKYWQPFNGYDSLSLEDCYRQLRGSASACEVSVLGDLYEVNLIECVCRPIYWSVKDPWKVLRGYWFEVIGNKWYPMSEHDYPLIEEQHCSAGWRERAWADAQLQAWSMSGPATASSSAATPPANSTTKSISRTQSASSKQQTCVIRHRLALEKHEILWIGDNEIYRMKKELSTQLWSKMGAKFGQGELYGANKLVRGYKDPASREDRYPPIGHIVFIVHGIGQNMDASDIAKSTSDFRETCSQVAKKHFPDQWREKRVEFLPVEWRTWLTLDKGLLEMITPHGIKALRGLVNDSVLDVMFYLSPKFGPETLDGLRFALNKQFKEFTRRHPFFLSNGGTVSIFAHSLGSVMMYDLFQETCAAHEIKHEDPHDVNSESSQASAVGQERVEIGGPQGVKFSAESGSPDSSLMEDETDGDREVSRKEEEEAREELERLRKRVAELEDKLGIGKKKPQGLKFMVDHFFAVGSPLALFIMMREHETLIKRGHKSAASLIPTCICKRIHNLHHPSDPVAYRIEPLVNQVYSQVKPVKVDTVGKPSQAALDHADGPVSGATQTQTKSSWFSWSGVVNLIDKAATGMTKKSPEPSRFPTKVMDHDKNLHSEDKLKERLDFMFRESFTENSYLNSITAHTGYWTSQDCANYVLLQLFRYKKSTDNL